MTRVYGLDAEPANLLFLYGLGHNGPLPLAKANKEDNTGNHKASRDDSAKVGHFPAHWVRRFHGTNITFAHILDDLENHH